MWKTIFKPAVFLRIVSVLLILFAAFYLGVSIYGANTFNVNHNRPANYGDNTPAKYDMAYQDVSFYSAGVPKLRLDGWWIPNAHSDRAIILVHGHNRDRARHLAWGRPLWDNGFNLLYFDTQGQGTSEGDRYYFGQREKYDVLAAFNFVKSKGFAPNKIGILAFSMGGASTLMALNLSPEIKVVVSDSAYANFEKSAEYRITRDTGLPKFFLPGILAAGTVMYGFDVNQTKPETTLPEVSGRRIMLIQGTADPDIAPDSVYSLQKAGGSNIVETWIVPGVGHIRAFDKYPFEYIERVTTFFNRELAQSRQDNAA